MLMMVLTTVGLLKAKVLSHGCCTLRRWTWLVDDLDVRSWFVVSSIWVTLFGANAWSGMTKQVSRKNLFLK